MGKTRDWRTGDYPQRITTDAMDADKVTKDNTEVRVQGRHLPGGHREH